MKTKTVFALLGLGTLVAVVITFQTRTRMPALEPSDADTNLFSSLSPLQPVAEPAAPAMSPAPRTISRMADRNGVSSESLEQPIPATNKLQRLTDIRELFRGLAAGDATAALREAKQLTEENERETALLTLVTEWTRGELSPAGQRARYISAFGLEAGLGMELLKTPELAIVWANELTDGRGRSALLGQIAMATGGSDPGAALALVAQVAENERSQFSRALYAGWAASDTAAALHYVDQLADPAERQAALQAVREVAPVGIGAELRTQDGYHVINRLLPGTPAELNGQLHAGDRIVGLAQGDSSFVDARGLSLAQVVQLVRGAPGTSLQLQVLAAEAPLDSPPRTISIVRDQIKYRK